MQNTAIICLPEQPLESWTIIIYRYFLVVSSVFLVLTFAVYSAIPEIRNIHGVTIMCYVASMAVMYITFALIQFKFGAYGNPTSNRICIALGRWFIDYYPSRFLLFIVNVLTIDGLLSNFYSCDCPLFLAVIFYLDQCHEF